MQNALTVVGNVTKAHLEIQNESKACNEYIHHSVTRINVSETKHQRQRKSIKGPISFTFFYLFKTIIRSHLSFRLSLRGKVEIILFKLKQENINVLPRSKKQCECEAVSFYFYVHHTLVWLYGSVMFFCFGQFAPTSHSIFE